MHLRLMMCPSLEHFGQIFYTPQVFETPSQNSSLHIISIVGQNGTRQKMPDIGVMSRWSINKNCHSVFLRYCPVILCSSDKYSRGVQRIDLFSELAPRLLRFMRYRRTKFRHIFSPLYSPLKFKMPDVTWPFQNAPFQCLAI